MTSALVSAGNRSSRPGSPASRVTSPEPRSVSTTPSASVRECRPSRTSRKLQARGCASFSKFHDSRLSTRTWSENHNSTRAVPSFSTWSGDSGVVGKPASPQDCNSDWYASRRILRPLSSGSSSSSTWIGGIFPLEGLLASEPTASASVRSPTSPAFSEAVHAGSPASASTHNAAVATPDRTITARPRRRQARCARSRRFRPAAPASRD